MSLVDDMKLSLRVMTDKLDAEVSMLVDAALADMARVGVRVELLERDLNGNLVSGDALVKQAVACYCKARFGFDNDEAPRFDESYRRSVCDLINSQASESLHDGTAPEIPVPDPSDEPVTGEPEATP